MADHLPIGELRDRVISAMNCRSLWDSALKYLVVRGHALPDAVINRDLDLAERLARIHNEAEVKLLSAFVEQKNKSAVQ